MNHVLFSDQGLRIRTVEARDIALFHAYEKMNSEKGFVVYQSEESHLISMGDPDILYVIIEDESTLEPIGYTILAGMTDLHSSIELRRIVVFMMDRGYGRRAIKLFKKYAFTVLNAHRLWLDVRRHNEKAYHLYKSEGFVDEGTLREAVYWNNQFIDVMVLSVLITEYMGTSG